jgi:hypothetical protein
VEWRSKTGQILSTLYVPLHGPGYVHEVFCFDACLLTVTAKQCHSKTSAGISREGSYGSSSFHAIVTVVFERINNNCFQSDFLGTLNSCFFYPSQSPYGALPFANSGSCTPSPFLTYVIDLQPSQSCRKCLSLGWLGIFTLWWLMGSIVLLVFCSSSLSFRPSRWHPILFFVVAAQSLSLFCSRNVGKYRRCLGKMDWLNYMYFARAAAGVWRVKNWRRGSRWRRARW